MAFEGESLEPMLDLFATQWPDVRLVAIFGSVVRGTARPESDVDVAVLGGSFWDQLAIGSEVSRYLRREPHVVDLAAASDWLRFEVARGGVAIFERSPGTWAQFQAQAALHHFDLAPLIELCASGVRRRLLREATSHG